MKRHELVSYPKWNEVSELGQSARDLSRWPSDLRSRVRFRAFTSLDSTQHFYDERCDVDRSSGAAVEQSELGWFDIRFDVDHDFLVPRLFEYGLLYPFIIPTSGGRNLKAEGGTSMRRRVFVDYSVRGGLGIGRK